MNGVFERGEGPIKTNAAQFAHVGFGKVLVGVPDVFWRVDEADVRLFAHGDKCGLRQIQKRASVTRAEVVQSA